MHRDGRRLAELVVLHGVTVLGDLRKFGCVASMKFTVDTMSASRIAELLIRERLIEFSLMSIVK